MNELFIPVSAGELIDKITILEIKEERIFDAEKLSNIRHELESLRSVMRTSLPSSKELLKLHQELKRVNISIWESEDDVRTITPDTEKETYLRATYNSHKMNEERFKLKRAINELCKSFIQEQKNYA